MTDAWASTRTLPRFGRRQRFDGLAATGVEGFEEFTDAVFDFRVLSWIYGRHFRGLRVYLVLRASQSLKRVGPRRGFSPGVRLWSVNAIPK